MTIEEVYSKLINHILEGVMFHDQLASYYDFLGLKGYRKCHEYHSAHEFCNYRKIYKYYMSRYHKLIPEVELSNPNVIPENWYRYTRQDVDPSTKKNAVKSALSSWIEWEKETKKLYEELYKELMDIDEISSAIELKEIICDVDHELKKAELCQIEKKSYDYDLGPIVCEQHEKYEKAQKELTRLYFK